MGRPWCLRPISTVSKTQLLIWTSVDEVPTPNLISNRHLSIQMTNSQAQSKIPLSPTWSKSKSTPSRANPTESTQPSTLGILFCTRGMLSGWPAYGALTAYALCTTWYPQRTRQFSLFPIKNLILQIFTSKVKSKAKIPSRVIKFPNLWLCMSIKCLKYKITTS